MLRSDPSAKGVCMDYIVAGLFVAVLVFEYFQTRQFMGSIRHLVRIISELKSFSLGIPKEKEGPSMRIPTEPGHPDFGLGQVVDEIEAAENDEEEPSL